MRKFAQKLTSITYQADIGKWIPKGVCWKALEDSLKHQKIENGPFLCRKIGCFQRQKYPKGAKRGKHFNVIMILQCLVNTLIHKISSTYFNIFLNFVFPESTICKFFIDYIIIHRSLNRHRYINQLLSNDTLKPACYKKGNFYRWIIKKH